MNDQTQRYIEALIEESSLNRLPRQYGGGRIFEAPVMGVARGDDPIFLKFNVKNVPPGVRDRPSRNRDTTRLPAIFMAALLRKK